MITSGGDIKESAGSAFNVYNIVFDAALGGVSSGIQGIKKPGLADGKLPDGVDGTSGTKTFNNWDDMKNAHKGTVTQYVKENKPKGSPTLKKWFEKGGTITIDDNNVWKYTIDDVTVFYVPTVIKGKVEYVVNFPKENLYPKQNIGQFSVPEGFSGNRSIDKSNALKYLKSKGINEIPDGYILHHDITNGVFQLVEEDVHSIFSHYGGYYYNK